MGGPAIVTTTTVEATKKRRLHPVRRVARLVCKLGSTRRREQEPEDFCPGPSFLHNLLPILEPFFVLDPKLLFIEDHIIGRRKRATSTAGSFLLPSNLDELKERVKEAKLPCNCDECDPKLYQIGEIKSHGRIRYSSGARNRRSLRFSHTHEIPNNPPPELRLRLYGDYEAMRLVRHHVAWLDQTYLQKPLDANTPAVLQLKSLLRVWRSNLIGSDMRQSTSRAQLADVFTHLNRVFFFDAVPANRKAFTAGFTWLPESKQNCFGISYFNPIIGTQILLHPTLYRHNSNPEDLDVRWRNRLGTILHEMCHAYLKAYTCRSCPMHDDCVGPRGHGRAWQILAAKIEQVAASLMDGYVDMGRFPSLLHDMEEHGRLPSSHDLEVYKLGERHVSRLVDTEEVGYKKEKAGILLCRVTSLEED